MITDFKPPAYLQDFNENQKKEWSKAIDGWTNEAINIEFKENNLFHQICQYYNPLHPPNELSGKVLDQKLVWNAFPRTLRIGKGELWEAYPSSEKLVKLSSCRPSLSTAQPFYKGPIWDTLSYRPLDEYCEWRETKPPYKI